MSNSIIPFEAHAELIELLELQFEDRITEEQFRRLESIIHDDPDARRVYLFYADLHGSLHWNTASTEFVGPGMKSDLRLRESESTTDSSAASSSAANSSSWTASAAQSANKSAPRVSLATDDGPQDFSDSGSQRTRNTIALVASVGCLLLVLVFGLRSGDRDEIAQDDKVEPKNLGSSPNEQIADVDPKKPKKLDPLKLSNDNSAPRNKQAVTSVDNSDNRIGSQETPKPLTLGSDDKVVAFINTQIKEGWSANELTPSDAATDAEWIRRVFLDVVGHIPTAEQTAEFLADKSRSKRQRVIESLLADEDYVRNGTTIWTNLMIGRSNPRQVDRGSMQKFLREAFALNRGWDEVVADIISAEGSAEENGAANFLIAHVNNQAVPATAITSRLFLGTQLQCMQCHDHPFDSGASQRHFWEFNSFFKQVKVFHTKSEINPSKRVAVLANEEEGGATFYEDRRGVMAAVFPRFNGVKVAADPAVNRRAELAKILTSGDSTQVARAFVNRMWNHYFGAAFTRAVDDMGPHAEVSHPELLDQLTREFVSSGYDIKRLTRWICQSEAYALSSQFSTNNEVDNPQLGNTALFSRAYVKSMSVEQLFDSVIIATDAQHAFGSDWEAVEHRRLEWLQQFVQAWNTDENDEADLFDGTIPQALMMMNGDLINTALSHRRALLNKVLMDSTSESDKIETISLAVLSRKPTAVESAAVRKMIRERERTNRMDSQSATASTLQDLFWAYLNSNEFILIH